MTPRRTDSNAGGVSAFVLALALALAGCSTGPVPLPSEPDAPIDTAGKTERWRTLPRPDHTLENFIPGATPD